MRYFLAFLVTFALILLLFLLLFHGGGKPVTGGKSLDSYASTDAVARLIIDGPINADESHQSIQITVGNEDVTFEQIQGYQGNVVNQQTFASNENAYANFLFALQHAGFNEGNTTPSLQDERGHCPLGDRYIFEFIQDGKTIEHYWATSCNGPKSYLGVVAPTMSLFEAQVPDYAALTKNIIL